MPPRSGVPIIVGLFWLYTRSLLTLFAFLSGEWETFFIEERVPVSTATVNERNQAAVEAQVCFFLLRTVLRA